MAIYHDSDFNLNMLRRSLHLDSKLNTDNNTIMEPFEVITSFKGRPQILYKSKVYNRRERRSTKKEKVRDTIYWKCKSVSNRCTGSLTTDINSSVIIASNENHHPDCEPVSEKSLQYKKILTSVKRKATEDFSEPPENVVTKKLRLADDKDKLGTRDLTNLKKCVYRARNQSIPHKVPKSLNEVFDQMQDVKENPQYMTGTSTKTEQFIYPFQSYGIMFITTITNLLFLCDVNNEHYLADGTFSYCPKYFQQLYTIHAFRNGYYIPLVHVALPGKSQEIYDRMWNLLKNLCLTTCGKVLTVKSLLVDYELAAINSAQNQFSIFSSRFFIPAWPI